MIEKVLLIEGYDIHLSTKYTTLTRVRFSFKIILVAEPKALRYS